MTSGQLFKKHGVFAWRALRRLGVRDADVDDACQDVFIAVHRKLGEFEGRSSPQTWIYGICVRVASDYRKRLVTKRESPSEPPDMAVEASQEDDVSLRQARVVLDRLLDRLDDEKRAVFVLYEIEELSMNDVALAVGCPLQTAYSRLHAARRNLDLAVSELRELDAVRSSS